MPKRSERPKSIVPFYMYRGQARTPATSRINIRSVLAWGVALVLVGLVGWLYLLQASQVASYAHEIRTLQLAKERIHRQNTILIGQVAESGSLTRIHEAGEQLGYTLPSAEDATRRISVVYDPLPTPTPTAGASSGTSTTESSQTSQGGAQSLLGRLQGQLDEWLHSTESGTDGE